jgi:hypothetical protein
MRTTRASWHAVQRDRVRQSILLCPDRQPGREVTR